MTIPRLRQLATNWSLGIGFMGVLACAALAPESAHGRNPPPVPLPSEPADTDGQDDDLNNNLTGPGVDASALANLATGNDCGSAPIAGTDGFVAAGEREATLAWFLTYLGRL